MDLGGGARKERERSSRKLFESCKQEVRVACTKVIVVGMTRRGQIHNRTPPNGT